MADFAGAVAAIRSLLSAGRPVEMPIVWPNERRPDITDADGKPAPWAYAEVASTQANIRGVGVPGDHVVIEDGLIILTVFVPDGEGDAIGFSLAGTLGEIFRVKQFYDSEPGTCVRSWTPSIGGGDAGSDDGMWFSVTVTIPFEFWRRA
jgi:hypothetical protein